MSINKLKVQYKNSFVELPDWIIFAFEIGAYLNDHGVKYKKPLNILLSLPSGHYFSLFVAMGIADKAFSVNKQMRSIRKTILSLVKGSRIIYQDEQSSRKVSVISIEPSPVFENEMILKIQDGKFIRGIPERQWVDRVTLLDEEFDEIKRTRKVSQKQKIGLDSNRLLRELYSTNQLNKVSFYPGDNFYLIGNTADISERMYEEIFLFKNVKGTIGDFLYLDNSNSYTNGKLLSSQMKKNDIEINSEVPVIFSDLNSYVKQQKYFKSNPKLIISSRSDNESRIYEVKEEIKRALLQDDFKIVTEELVDHLKSTEIKLPTGIEFLTWR